MTLSRCAMSALLSKTLWRWNWTRRGPAILRNVFISRAHICCMFRSGIVQSGIVEKYARSIHQETNANCCYAHRSAPVPMRQTRCILRVCYAYLRHPEEPLLCESPRYDVMSRQVSGEPVLNMQSLVNQLNPPYWKRGLIWFGYQCDG